MKARRKGTNYPFKTVEGIQLKDSDILYDANVMEFEQDVITTHDTLSTELKTYDQTEENKHWQEVRERAAIDAMGQLIGMGRDDGYKYSPLEVANFAVVYANALVEQLKTKK